MAEPSPSALPPRRGPGPERRRHHGRAGGGPAFHLNLSSARADLDRSTAKGPVVQVVEAGSSAAAQKVTVLASVTPYQQATLYAKVSGYLAKVLVDKGDAVKTGQLLATIESQETDAQYNSARADLLNKQRIAQRYDQLLRQNAIAAQQADQADADARVAQATLGPVWHSEIL